MALTKAVSAILAKAVEGTLTERELTRTVLQNAFGESLFTIPAKLTDGSWPLLTQDFGTRCIGNRISRLRPWKSSG